MYYLFRDGIGEAVSGSREALKELTVTGKHTETKRMPQPDGDALVETVDVVDYDPKAKIVEDARWLNPADLYLDEKGNIAVKEYEPLSSKTEPQELPDDPERLAVYEAMAAQEERIAAQAERLTVLEAALKAKGGDSK